MGPSHWRFFMCKLHLVSIHCEKASVVAVLVARLRSWPWLCFVCKLWCTTVSNDTGNANILCFLLVLLMCLRIFFLGLIHELYPRFLVCSKSLMNKVFDKWIILSRTSISMRRTFFGI